MAGQKNMDKIWIWTDKNIENMDEKSGKKIWIFGTKSLYLRMDNPKKISPAARFLRMDNLKPRPIPGYKAKVPAGRSARYAKTGLGT